MEAFEFVSPLLERPLTIRQESTGTIGKRWR